MVIQWFTGNLENENSSEKKNKDKRKQYKQVL